MLVWSPFISDTYQGDGLCDLGWLSALMATDVSKTLDLQSYSRPGLKMYISYTLYGDVSQTFATILATIIIAP